MTVKELIEKLQQEDPDRLAVMSKDGKGNSFLPLSDISVYAYGELTDEDREQGYIMKNIVVDGQKAIVLWPTN